MKTKKTAEAVFLCVVEEVLRVLKVLRVIQSKLISPLKLLEQHLRCA